MPSRRELTALGPMKANTVIIDTATYRSSANIKSSDPAGLSASENCYSSNEEINNTLYNR